LQNDETVILSRGQFNSNYWTLKTFKYGIVEYIATVEKAYARTQLTTNINKPYNQRQCLLLERYLPLNENNPAKTIDTFFKLTMLQ